MSSAETKNDAPETGRRESEVPCVEQFMKMMEQCGCGCGPMMAKMMAAMTAGKDVAEDEEQFKDRR